MIKNTNEQNNSVQMFTGTKLKKKEIHTHIGALSLNTAETGDNVPCLSSLFIAFFIKYHYVWYDWVFVVSHHVMLSINLDRCIVEFCNKSCIANVSTVLYSANHLSNIHKMNMCGVHIVMWLQELFIEHRSEAKTDTKR